MSNSQNKPTAEHVEYTKLLLGHRTRFEKTGDSERVFEISHYAPAPVQLTRPAKRRVDTAVQCTTCGKALRVRLWNSIEGRGAGRRRWWYAFGLFTAAIWSLFGAAFSAVGVDLLRGIAVLLGLLWGAVLLVGGIVAGNAEPLHNDAWVKVLRGRGKHRMLRPGQTRVVVSYAKEGTI